LGYYTGGGKTKGKKASDWFVIASRGIILWGEYLALRKNGLFSQEKNKKGSYNGTVFSKRSLGGGVG